MTEGNMEQADTEQVNLEQEQVNLEQEQVNLEQEQGEEDLEEDMEEDNTPVYNLYIIRPSFHVEDPEGMPLPLEERPRGVRVWAKSPDHAAYLYELQLRILLNSPASTT